MTVKTLRNLFQLGRAGSSGSRFNRYYSGVLRPGAGYPTADEARRDMRHYDRVTQHITWMR